MEAKGLSHTYTCIHSPPIKPVNPKGNQSWIFIGWTDADVETPIIWPPDSKKWLIGKGPNAGKDWRQEEKGMTEDEMVGWHHWLNGPEFEQTLGVGDGQGSMACCSPWGYKESDVTEDLNWTDPLLNSPPTQAATQHWAKFPVLDSRSLLVIHFKYSSVYMSIPNSLTIPFPHPSPLTVMSWFWKSASARWHSDKDYLPMQETQEISVQSLGWEDPLEREMATHSRILAWRIPWKRSLVGPSPWGCKESDITEHAHTELIRIASF